MGRKYALAYGDAVEKLADVSGRLGSIVLYELEDPTAVLAVAEGVISRRMIRQEIDHVAKFAVGHPEGWCYLADVRRVRGFNPLNLFALRTLARLPGVRARAIVAPSFARVFRPIAIGDVTTSVDDALQLCRGAPQAERRSR